VSYAGFIARLQLALSVVPEYIMIMSTAYAGVAKAAKL
jgi:hypothetical protein